MNQSSSDSQDDNIGSLLNTLTSVENPKSVCSETCYGTGYNASPDNKGISILMTTPRAIVTEMSILGIGHQNLFIASPIKSLFMDGCGTSKDYFNSPLKMGSTILSPFKDSSLSPFKSMNQSPFKGFFDEWDKDFIASFEEKLFGIADISETLDELLKSPQGKALLESKRHSPNKPGSSVARRLKISPENRQKHTSRNFQALHDQSSDVFSLPVHTKADPTDTCKTVNTFKEEKIEYDHLYGQYNRVYVNNPLTAVDPDKMSATPIKPRFTSVDSAPVRRLAMKVIGGHSTVLAGHGTTPNIGKNMLYNKPMPQAQSVVHVWPVKERLKYARLQFQEVLNKAVEKEIEILKEEKRKKFELKNIKNISKQKENVQCTDKKSVPGDLKIGTVCRNTMSKSKVPIKRKKNEKWPQPDKALSKPVKSHGFPKRFQKTDKDQDYSTDQELHHFLFDTSGTSDLGWCPSNEDDSSDEDNVWTGSLPFHSQSSSGVFSEENEDDDENVHISKKRQKLLTDP